MRWTVHRTHHSPDTPGLQPVQTVALKIVYLIYLPYPWGTSFLYFTGAFARKLLQNWTQ